MASLQQKIDYLGRFGARIMHKDIDKAIQELREEVIDFCEKWDFSGVIERELLALIGEKK